MLFLYRKHKNKELYNEVTQLT